MKHDVFLELISIKDADKSVKKENTIKCFELVKDWVIKDLIRRLRESDFKDTWIYTNGVHEELFRRLDLNISELTERPFFSDRLGRIRYEPWFCYDITINVNEKDTDTAFMQYKAILEFLSKFDGELFEKLIISHVLGFGFKHKYTVNLWGQKVESGKFIMTREKLDKNINKIKNKELFEKTRDLNEKLIGASIIAVTIIFAIMLFAFS